LSVSRQLMLPYWYWTGQDPRWSDLASPARGGLLLPMRSYARTVATLGEQFRDNSGADWRKNREHPGSQELIWGIGDYPVTPEAHMRHVRELGEKSLAAAERALPAVKKNQEEATSIFNFMKAYKLLADYYERKVLAAVAALIYGFGGPKTCKEEAEKLADQAVERYEVAAQFIWESMDRKSGNLKGRWLDGKALTMPELIERENRERQELPILFAWDKKGGAARGDKQGTAPKAGTFVPREP